MMKTSNAAFFPEYLALVNPMASQAFAMLYVKEGIPEAGSSWVLSESSGYAESWGPRDWSPRKPCVDAIFEWTTWCEVGEAFLIVSPFVKFVDKPTGLDTATLSFDMDGESVISRAPLRDYVVGGNVDVKPLPARASAIFYSCLIDENNFADASHCYGLMAPHGTRLQIFLHRMGPAKELVRVECGLVAALYTTRGGVERKIQSIINGPLL